MCDLTPSYKKAIEIYKGKIEALKKKYPDHSYSFMAEYKLLLFRIKQFQACVDRTFKKES